MASKRKTKRARMRSVPAPVVLMASPLRAVREPVQLKNEDEVRAFFGPDSPKSGELDLIRDTIVKHRMHAENIKERLAELVARLFGEGQASANDGDSAPAVSMLARIRDETDELGAVLAGASDILNKLETL